MNWLLNMSALDLAIALTLTLMPLTPNTAIPAGADAGVKLICDQNFKPLASAIYKTEPVADPALIRNTSSLTKNNVTYLITQKGHDAHPAIFKTVSVINSNKVAIFSYGCSFGDQQAGRILMDQIGQLTDRQGKDLVAEKSMTEDTLEPENDQAPPLPEPEFWFEDERPGFNKTHSEETAK